MQPNERDVRQLVEDSGCHLRLVPPRSYILEGLHGSFLIENLTPADECFSHAILGSLNVTKAQEICVRSQPVFNVQIDRALLESASLTDLDQSTIEKMTLEREDQPVIFLSHRDGRTYVIDGAHRLYVRARRYRSFIKAYHLPALALAQIRCRTWKLHTDGTKTEIDMTSKVIDPISSSPVR